MQSTGTGNENLVTWETHKNTQNVNITLQQGHPVGDAHCGVPTPPNPSLQHPPLIHHTQIFKSFTLKSESRSRLPGTQDFNHLQFSYVQYFSDKEKNTLSCDKYENYDLGKGEGNSKTPKL